MCESPEIKSVCEWGDSDYPEGLLVPVEPIDHETEVRENKYKRTEEKIPVYDVSQLFSGKEAKC